MERDTFEGWAFLELMGHRKLAGYVREATVGGASMVRIDVPDGADPKIVATQFYSAAALYAVTPTTEEMARRYAARCKPAPVEEWELPKRPALPVSPTVGGEVGGPSDDDVDEGFTR